VIQERIFSDSGKDMQCFRKGYSVFQERICSVIIGLFLHSELVYHVLQGWPSGHSPMRYTIVLLTSSQLLDHNLFVVRRVHLLESITT